MTGKHDKEDPPRRVPVSADELVPAMAERINQLTAERDEARAAVQLVRELAEQLAALAPPGRNDASVLDILTADTARRFLAAIDGSGT